MLNTSDALVLASLRRMPTGEAVLFDCNFTSEPQKVSFDLKVVDGHVTNVVVLSNAAGQQLPASLTNITLKPFGVAVLQIH